MKVESMYRGDNGKHYGFSIENIYISVKKTALILADVEGVTDVRLRKLFRRGEFGDARVKFKYQNKECEVLEPFGDNSDYWIEPVEDGDFGELNLQPIEQAFKDYKLPVMTKLVGDIVSLKFITVFFK